jgi:hypothetical protein
LRTISMSNGTLRGLMIVLGVTLAGILLPLAFREQLETFVASHTVCDILAAGQKAGQLDTRGRQDLVDAVLAADIDPSLKSIVTRTRAGCRKGNK